MFGQKRHITATHIRQIPQERVADELFYHITEVAMTALIFERGPVGCKSDSIRYIDPLTHSSVATTPERRHCRQPFEFESSQRIRTFHLCVLCTGTDRDSELGPICRSSRTGEVNRSVYA